MMLDARYAKLRAMRQEDSYSRLSISKRLKVCIQQGAIMNRLSGSPFGKGVLSNLLQVRLCSRSQFVMGQVISPSFERLLQTPQRQFCG